MFKSAQVIFAAVLMMASFSFAMAAPKTMKCPDCGMQMPTKKSAAANVPIYSKKYKTVYYCCPGCKMGTEAGVYFKKHHKAMPV